MLSPLSSANIERLLVVFLSVPSLSFPRVVLFVCRYTIEQALVHPWVTGETASDNVIDSSVVKYVLNLSCQWLFQPFLV